MRKEPFDLGSGWDEIEPWCRRHLGCGIAGDRFRTGWQSAVAGLELEDGRAVVVKVRPDRGTAAGCDAVHRHLWQAGFPCPEPLVPPTPFGRWSATAEVFVDGGVMRHGDAHQPGDFARLLVALVRLAPDPSSVPTLAPPPSWVWWSHRSAGRWPPAVTEGEIDMEAIREPGWLRDVAAAVGARLAACDLPVMVGHADWESQNIRWQGRRPHVVHDWDSACALPEAAFAGLASSVFTATDDDRPATFDQSEAFLAAYAEERGRPWSRDEEEVAWCAGLWVTAYNAVGGFVDGEGGPGAAHLRDELDARMARAGLW